MSSCTCAGYQELLSTSVHRKLIAKEERYQISRFLRPQSLHLHFDRLYDAFCRLDENGDGKVTADEIGTVAQAICGYINMLLQPKFWATRPRRKRSSPRWTWTATGSCSCLSRRYQSFARSIIDYEEFLKVWSKHENSDLDKVRSHSMPLFCSSPSDGDCVRLVAQAKDSKEESKNAEKKS